MFLRRAAARTNIPHAMENLSFHSAHASILKIIASLAKCTRRIFASIYTLPRFVTRRRPFIRIKRIGGSYSSAAFISWLTLGHF